MKTILAFFIYYWKYLFYGRVYRMDLANKELNDSLKKTRKKKDTIKTIYAVCDKGIIEDNLSAGCKITISSSARISYTNINWADQIIESIIDDSKHPKRSKRVPERIVKLLLAEKYDEIIQLGLLK